jgi:hypothetical protein
VEISDGVGGATGRSCWVIVCGDGRSPQQTEVVGKSSRDEGSWSSKTVRLVTLCVHGRQTAFCPLGGWGGGVPVWEGWLEEMSSVGRNGSAIVPGNGQRGTVDKYRKGRWHQMWAQNLGIATAWGCGWED